MFKQFFCHANVWWQTALGSNYQGHLSRWALCCYWPFSRSIKAMMLSRSSCLRAKGFLFFDLFSISWCFVWASICNTIYWRRFSICCLLEMHFSISPELGPFCSSVWYWPLDSFEKQKLNRQFLHTGPTVDHRNFCDKIELQTSKRKPRRIIIYETLRKEDPSSMTSFQLQLNFVAENAMIDHRTTSVHYLHFVWKHVY